MQLLRCCQIFKTHAIANDSTMSAPGYKTKLGWIGWWICCCCSCKRVHPWITHLMDFKTTSTTNSCVDLEILEILRPSGWPGREAPGYVGCKLGKTRGQSHALHRQYCVKQYIWLNLCWRNRKAHVGEIRNYIPTQVYGCSSSKTSVTVRA